MAEAEGREERSVSDQYIRIHTTASRWDVGDPEPPPDVIGVRDYTDGDCDGCSPHWGRTVNDPGTWKGYKDGGKVYLSWADLTRHWGPVTAA